MRKPVINYSDIEAAAISEECIGFCLSCGTARDGVEPDAGKYKCHNCRKFEVYGAEEILVMGIELIMPHVEPYGTEPTYERGELICVGYKDCVYLEPLGQRTLAAFDNRAYWHKIINHHGRIEAVTTNEIKSNKRILKRFDILKT